jgi:DNA repair photolyase
MRARLHLLLRPAEPRVPRSLAGLDFETKLFAKPNAATLLRAELAKPGYRCDPIALGANTDPYQPIEREWKVTRSVIEVLAECEHPLTITTKGVLIERDLDLLAPMAAKGLVRVFVSVAMLDKELARKLDPRAPAPHRRLQIVKALSDAGHPDRRQRRARHSAAHRPRPRRHPRGGGAGGRASRQLDHAAAAPRARPAVSGVARCALPAPGGARDEHRPQIRGGKDNDSRFGVRMEGRGEFANLIDKRFALACNRLGLNIERDPALDTSRFRPPPANERQLALF